MSVDKAEHLLQGQYQSESIALNKLLKFLALFLRLITFVECVHVVMFMLLKNQLQTSIHRYLDDTRNPNASIFELMLYFDYEWLYNYWPIPKVVELLD